MLSNTNSGDAPDPIYKFVGTRLRALRNERGYTQGNIADEIGVSAQQYQKYEDAQSKCSLTNLFKIADFLDVELKEILPISPQQNSQAAPPQAAASAPIQVEPVPACSSSDDDLDGEQLARLMTAFLRISNPDSRRKIIELIEVM